MSAQPQPELRPTRVRELPSIVSILRSTAHWYAPFVAEDDLKTQHLVDLEWAQANYKKREFYSAIVEGEVVGVLTLQDAGDHLYLGYVYVHREHVGKRIGRTLLDFAADQAERRGKDGMVLIAHPEATWAIRAYEKYGFQCIADDDDAVTAWNDGWLSPYHEEGFTLWRFAMS
jgi:GNAT superfamily N-acetyltransferase